MAALRQSALLRQGRYRQIHDVAKCVGGWNDFLKENGGDDNVDYVSSGRLPPWLWEVLARARHRNNALKTRTGL